MMRGAIRLTSGDVIELAGAFSDEAVFYDGGVLVDSAAVVGIRRTPTTDPEWSATLDQLERRTPGVQAWFPEVAVRYVIWEDR